jgi:hypothetical protein
MGLPVTGQVLLPTSTNLAEAAAAIATDPGVDHPRFPKRQQLPPDTGLHHEAIINPPNKAKQKINPNWTSLLIAHSLFV